MSSPLYLLKPRDPLIHRTPNTLNCDIEIIYLRLKYSSSQTHIPVYQRNVKSFIFRVENREIQENSHI